LEDRSLYVFGKNDRGQLGVGAGVGIDMVESENFPALVKLEDEKLKIKDFHCG
jgi:alpha-tubulin suppressor-like RCC1 family protein